MLGLNEKIKSLSKSGRSIKVAVVGVGQMGKGLISHLKGLRGFEVLAVVDKDLEKAMNTLKDLDFHNEDLLLVENVTCNDNLSINDALSISKNLAGKIKKQVNDAAAKKITVLTNDISVPPTIENVDVIIDATGYPEAGAIITLSALGGGKHVVTLNVESDTTIGPILKRIAEKNSRIYTLSAGDEPAALKELHDFADGIGLEIIAAGKGKNNPLDFEANPTTLADYAAKKGSSAKMMTSFVDGTKSMIEMACLSNATGLIPDCRGMHGPKSNIKDLAEIFSLKKDGGILGKKGIVDFVIGDLAPGVFLVYSAENKMVREILNYLQLGKGPNYLLYRPYHLTSIETPLSIARVYFYKEPTIVPAGGLVSEVITVAKKDLKAGEIIDGIGGYTVFGLIDLYEIARKKNLLPIGLSQGCVIKRDLKKGYPLSYDDVELKYDSLILKLRKLQDGTLQ
ncbi:MAG: SAF domain-containing protein [Actinobacteria bacterium]|nr:SAF domain-containing protein [Actinomycetota bacterium]